VELVGAERANHHMQSSENHGVFVQRPCATCD
jgi:hypothetical protein